MHRATGSAQRRLSCTVTTTVRRSPGFCYVLPWRRCYERCETSFTNHDNSMGPVENKKKGGQQMWHKVQYHCSEGTLWNSGRLGMLSSVLRRGLLGRRCRRGTLLWYYDTLV